ncbi:hypothetical protein FH5_03521 [Priestia endophytica]|nr:hypothetical protein FH5_03521 [Priestia endophytica]
MLRENGVEFISIQDKIDTGTAAGKAMFGMLSVVSEYEFQIIYFANKKVKKFNCMQSYFSRGMSYKFLEYEKNKIDIWWKKLINIFTTHKQYRTKANFKGWFK